MRRRQGSGTREGRFSNGIEYIAAGDGPRNLLWLQGGPGSGLPPGLMMRAFTGTWAPLVDAGFTVWMLTRRRGMPAGYAISDMADDVADVIAAEFDGKADVVVGESYGGLIAQYLAANHPGRVGRLVLSSSACRFDHRFDDADRRLVEAICAGDRTRAGAALAESVMPGVRYRFVRLLLAPLFGWFVTGYGTGQDPLVEYQAELDYDSRPVLPRITAPVLLVAGDHDLIFPKAFVAETARLIPACNLIWYEGMGHMRAAASRRLPHDIVAFAGLTRS
ncbi:MAG: alpha/beta hydrolase [Candidatus Nanopelagicales bacterium]